MSPKMGRPKSDNPKAFNFGVRLDKKTGEILEKYCKENNVTKSEAIRRGINLLIKEK